MEHEQIVNSDFAAIAPGASFVVTTGRAVDVDKLELDADERTDRASKPYKSKGKKKLPTNNTISSMVGAE